ncbi:MAG TPA: HIT family protein [Bryobacteraceae bacterium]|nr:HIT family protein [Bryobacteraceae bacterium]
MPCLFCEIARHAIPAAIVFEDDNSVAFLDHRPLFHGHCLLIPKDHAETLADLPQDAVGPLFQTAQLLAKAVEQGMSAEGSFVAVNNRISQSVPHLHIHIVPRRKGDGLKGFFWPRTKYADDETLDAVRKHVADALTALIH